MSQIGLSTVGKLCAKRYWHSCQAWACMLSLTASSAVMAKDYDWSVNQIRGGIFAHNRGLIASKEESGVDLNAELALQPIDVLLGAEPAIGVMINNVGHTSFLYTGLSWEVSLLRSVEPQGLFFMPFFGAAIHDGKKEPEPKRRGLGCRFLFRQAIELGWRFSEAFAISAQTDHLSHGGLCANNNQGLDNSGIRLHWKL